MRVHFSHLITILHLLEKFKNKNSSSFGKFSEDEIDTKTKQTYSYETLVQESVGLLKSDPVLPE